MDLKKLFFKCLNTSMAVVVPFTSLVAMPITTGAAENNTNLIVELGNGGTVVLKKVKQ